MSTGRRLAKRSIIGTKVCAPGPDGLWYSGVIQDVKTPPSATVTSGDATGDTAATAATVATAAPADGCSANADTRYIVRFDFKTQSVHGPADTAVPATSTASGPGVSKASVIMEAQRAAHVHTSPAQTLRRNAMIKEFRESDLVGPGFRSISGIQLQPGQRVYLTHNGRETSADVLAHDAQRDEVIVKITSIGAEEPIELKKRLEEVRLLESRRSARLADQERDTDFARLADMGGDRRRTSHSIEVPLSLTPQHNSSRKRPPSYAHECSSDQCNEEEMNECNAAMILVTLSNSPKSPKNADKWFGSSPGSSSASWSSGSSSPPLSDDGHVVNALLHGASASARIRTTSVSTSDEGIVVDFKEDAPRKKRASRSRFICTWKGCNFVEHTPPKIERHIRIVHLGIKKPRRSTEYADGSVSDSDHEEEFYYTEVEDDDDEGKTPSPTSPPTLSHRDMARPPHEDPEYQRQIVGTFKQGRAASLQMQQQQQQQQHSGARATHHSNSTHISSSHQQQSQISNASQIPTSPLAHHNYTWPAESGPTFAAIIPTPTSTTAHYHQQQQQSSSAAATALVKHARASPRPSHCTGPYPSPAHVHQHHNYSSPAAHNGGGGGSSSTHSPIVHSNNPSSVLQQLSQQNITVTAHHSGGTQQQQHQQHQQQQQQQQQSLAMVTITPNFAHNSSHRSHQHHGRGGSGQREHLHHQQLQQHSPTTTTASSSMAASATARMPPQHHHQHVAVQHAIAAAKHTPNSPNRRTRGENKKCRKVYGMERRDMWCTQCRWKKACSRFGD